MNLKGSFPKHEVWAGALPDIDRIVEIRTECLGLYGGPFLFGAQRSMADAMYAPVVTRFLTYDVALPPACQAYCQTIMAMPEMLEWGCGAAGAQGDRRTGHGFLRRSVCFCIGAGLLRAGLGSLLTLVCCLNAVVHAFERKRRAGLACSAPCHPVASASLRRQTG